jgi:hypothetical protein
MANNLRGTNRLSIMPLRINGSHVFLPVKLKPLEWEEQRPELAPRFWTTQTEVMRFERACDATNIDAQYRKRTTTNGDQAFLVESSNVYLGMENGTEKLD